MIHRRWFIALFLSCSAIASAAVADFAGKVVGVSDGDTLTVLRGWCPGLIAGRS
jgi:hypothetical protein